MRRSVSFETLMNYKYRSRVSMRSTFSIYHVLFHYLQFCTCSVLVSSTTALQARDAPRHIHKKAMGVIKGLAYDQPCWCQLDCNCDDPSVTTTKVVDDTATYSTSTPSWTWTTVADGHKLLAVSLSRPLLDWSKNAILPTPAASGALVGNDSIRISQRSFSS